MDPVAVVACPDYQPERVQQALREAVSQVADPGELFRGRRVLLKPNLLSDHKPEDAVTTHPEIVRAAIRLVREAGGIPLVGDSPALKGRSEARYRRTCEVTGIAQVVEQEGAELVWLDRGKIEVHFADGRARRQFALSEEVVRADAVLNLPKLKTHGLMVLTGGVKNLFGCIPGLKKANYHLTLPDDRYFAEMLLDLAALVRPALTVMDAVVAMDGHGPSNGRPKPVGYLLASRSPLAADWMAAGLVGAPVDRVPILRAARERGLLDPPMPELPVAPIPDFQAPAAPKQDMPPWLGNLLKNHLTRRPWMSVERCNLCGDCRQICPPQALTPGEGRMVVDYRACIRCFCCHEVCKQDAVVLRQSWLAGILSRGNNIVR